MKTANIVPILLAAGSSGQLGFPKPLARFGGKTALEIAVENCSGLPTPLLVLGDQAAQVFAEAPPEVLLVVNGGWRSGQLSSVMAGLRRVPRDAAFMIYPVDHPLLTLRLIRRLVKAFETRARHEKIVMPRCDGRAGHPVILSAILREELRRAQTAREVVYRDPRRIRYVDVASTAIWQDFDSPASYARLRRQFDLRRRKREPSAGREVEGILPRR